MEELSEEQLAVLPEWMRQAYGEAVEGVEFVKSLGLGETNAVGWTVIRLVHELARALTPLPCGHPGASVVSMPSADGSDVRAAAAGTMGYCRWCADIDTLEIEVLRTAFRAAVKERDALREKLKAAEANRDGLREMVARLTDLTGRYKRERNALREKYGELPPGECAWVYPENGNREKLKATENEMGRLRLNEAAYLRGQEEIVRDQDNLRARFKAAKGLAHQASCVVATELVNHVRKDTEFLALTGLEQALAAWKEVND